MRIRFLLFLFGALTISSPCFAATEVQLLSTVGWKSTGMMVKAGTSYGVWQTHGTWTVDYRNFAYVDGGGYSPQTDALIYQGCKYNSLWPYGLLLGRVGNNVFPIGRGISFKAPQNGLLELSINDRCLQDNRGTLFVKVDAGRNVQGVLNQLVDNQVRNLTPAERDRLLLYAKNSFVCGSLGGNVYSLDCMQVILGLLSFVVIPQQVE